MKWKDVILGSLVTMGVAVVAGVLIYYLTREPHRPELKRQVWELLNEICPQAMLREGRVYGGGLHKLEPKELGNVPAEAITELLPESERPRWEKQLELFEFP